MFTLTSHWSYSVLSGDHTFFAHAIDDDLGDAEILTNKSINKPLGLTIPCISSCRMAQNSSFYFAALPFLFSTYPWML